MSPKDSGEIPATHAAVQQGLVEMRLKLISAELKVLNTNSILSFLQVRATDFPQTSRTEWARVVVQYASASSAGGWFYRELIPGTKSYRTKRIKDVQALEEAVLAATDVAFQMQAASAGSEAVLGGCY